MSRASSTFLRAACASLALLLASACGSREASSELDVALTFEPSPPRVGAVDVEVVLRDADGDPFTGANVVLEGNMNHAGMVPEIATAEEGAAGVYTAPMEFTMGGDWFFVVTATGPDGRRIEHVVEVPGVSTESGEGP